MAQIPDPPLSLAGAIVCYAKCWPCQFGEHPAQPHTWMDDEDIEFSKDVEWPTTPDQWAALAASHPCGCWCLKETPCPTCKGSGSHPANADYPCPQCNGRMVANPTTDQTAGADR